MITFMTNCAENVITYLLCMHVDPNYTYCWGSFWHNSIITGLQPASFWCPNAMSLLHWSIPCTNKSYSSVDWIYLMQSHYCCCIIMCISGSFLFQLNIVLLKIPNAICRLFDKALRCATRKYYIYFSQMECCDIHMYIKHDKKYTKYDNH